MKSFLYKVLWFVLPILLLSLSLEYSIRALDNTYKLKKEYLDKHAKDVEVLILGSSHAYYNLNPEYIDQVTFNAGAVSQSFDIDLAILTSYEQNFNRLNTILLPVSYFSFYGTLKDSPEKWRMKDYILYYDLDIPSAFKDHFEILSVKPKNNIKRVYASLKNKQTKLNCSPLGWGNNYLVHSSMSLESTGLEASNRHTQDHVFSEESKLKFNQAFQDLKGIVEWSKKHNVNLVLFIPPGYETYTSNLNEDQLNQVVKTLDGFSKEYATCQYFDFLTNKSFTKEDFYDADHLNHQGAKKLSKRLNSILK